MISVKSVEQKKPEWLHKELSEDVGSGEVSVRSRDDGLIMPSSCRRCDYVKMSDATIYIVSFV